MTQNNTKEISEYPMRINKYLAHHNYSTRRGADTLIENGNVTINGQRAQLGDKVFENDVVRVAGAVEQEHVYLAYYKPRGVVTFGAQAGEKEIKEILNFDQPVFPLGRLDKDSEGLIIMTNDGRITERLLDPKYHHEKEYAVEIDGEVTHKFLVAMRNGIAIDLGQETYKTKPAKIRKTGKHNFEIVLTEGKNRQIRKMCGTFGYKVTELKRIRVLNIQLDSVKSGQFRKIKGAELKEFLEILNRA